MTPYHEAILAALARSGRSAREVSRAALGHESAVRSLNRGLDLRGSTIQALCRELGLEFYVGPPRTTDGPQADSASAPSPSNIVPGTQVLRSLTTFSWRTALPVREWGLCSPEGYLSKPREIARAPAPVDLLDDEAFYGQMMGQSMMREGISGFGAYSLISPNTPLDVDELVWLRDRRDQEVVRRLIAADGEAYSLRGWGPADERGHQERLDERWMRADVVAAGVVLAVYEGWPSVKSPPFRVPDVTGSEGQQVIRVPVVDQQLATLLVALVGHYDRLNEYGRELFVAEMQRHFPVGQGAENPHLSASTGEG